MRIDLLREFVLLAENLNFTVTAKQCFITQSVLSRHIASVEKELGVSLFIRDRNRIRLTRSGELFYEKMKDLIGDYDEAVRETYNLERETDGTLRVAFLYGASHLFLSEACQHFRLNNPSMDLVLYSGEVDSSLQGIAKNKFDLALTVSYGNINSTWYKTHSIYKDAFMIAVCVSHPLAQKESIPLSDLSEERVTLFSQEENAELVNYIEHTFTERGLHIDTRNLITSLESFVLGFDPDNVAIVPGCFASFSYNHDLCFLPIADDFLDIDFCAIWKASEKNNPSISAFIDSVEFVLDGLTKTGQIREDAAGRHLAVRKNPTLC